MKRTFIVSGIVTVLGIAVGMSSPAFAQRGGRGKDPAAAKVAKEKRFDFEADEVTGELVKPEGTDIRVRSFREHSSLIRVRADFIREIVKSAEDL